MKLRGGRRKKGTRKRRNMIRRISSKSGKAVRNISRDVGRITGRVPIVGRTSKKVFNLFGREGQGLISIAGDTINRGTKIITSPIKRLLSLGRRSRGSRRSRRSRRSRGSRRSRRSRRSRGTRRSRRSRGSRKPRRSRRSRRSRGSRKPRRSRRSRRSRGSRKPRRSRRSRR